MSSRLVFSALAAAALALPAFAVDIYVDNDAGAPGYTETGTWTTTSNAGAGWNGGLYRFTSNTNPPSTATWTPTIPTEGVYQVFAIFRASGDRPSVAPHTVNHADGSAVINVDQTGSFAGPLVEAPLGTYRFEAGTAGTVVLSNSGSAGNYIADTILFRSDPPPVITQTRHAPIYPQDSEPILATARVTDNTAVASVSVHWTATPSLASGTETASDDGAHGDGAAGDDIFGALLPGFASGETVAIQFEATDDVGNTALGASVEFTVGAEGNWNLILNEVLASNATTNFDLDFSEAGDWIEIHNLGPDTADLTGITLSDAPGNPTKWFFPPGSSLPAGAYQIIWCDDADFAGLELHTGFQLSSGGETVVLYDANTATVLDQIAYPELDTDQSFARLPNLSASWEATIIPTPAAANEAGARGDAPVFSIGSGVFSAPIMVEITATGASEIRYTLDGNTPDAGSPLYAAPLDISTSTPLRARAFYASLDPSRVTSASYLFGLPADRTIPIMDLVIDPDDLFNPSTGIHANPDEQGRAWERPVHVVVTSPNGASVEEADGGLRIHGGTTRDAAKKSFRLYLRNAYGQRDWSLPWLERTVAGDIRQLVLRAGGNDVFIVGSASQRDQVTYIRDQMLRDLLAAPGYIAGDGFYVALHINGQYWGLYNPTERISNDFMEEVQGGEDWDIVKGSWNSTLKYFTEAPDGNLDTWNAFLSWLFGSDLADGADFDELVQRLDLRNYLAWMALNISCQNEDWPQNNWISTRRQGDPYSRWIFHEWDAEWPIGLRPQGWTSNTLEWAQGDNFHLSPGHNGRIAPLCSLFNGDDVDPGEGNHNGILDNLEGRRMFIQAVEEVLNFELRPEDAIAMFDAHVSEIQSEIPREAARWASAAQATQWNTAVQNVRNFFTNRPAQMRNFVNLEFGLGGTQQLALTASGAGSGRAAVNGRVVHLPWSGTFFNGSPIELVALPDAGSAVETWSGGGTFGDEPVQSLVAAAGPELEIDLAFGTGAPDPRASGAIINEFWLNDGGTAYDSIAGRAIQGDWLELLVTGGPLDLRGWRVTNNRGLEETGKFDDGEGSIIFPEIPELSAVPKGTCVLIIASLNPANDATFPADDLDAGDGQMILCVANGNLDIYTDPGFSMRPGVEPIVLLAKGPSGVFPDDIAVDFVAEGSDITPASFGIASHGIVFNSPFSGLGDDDGAIFTNDPEGGLNNDDGADANTDDAAAGAGGWILDPPAQFTGDAMGATNILTPGAPNTGQNLDVLVNELSGVSLR